MPSSKLVPSSKLSEALTFADYFKLNVDITEILAAFGFEYQIAPCELPSKGSENGRLAALKQRLEETFPHVSLTSEVARREFLIAPVLIEAAHQAGARIQVEYPLEVDDRLKGTLDYFVRAPGRQMLVVEAKNGDLTRGFAQLAVELIALDRWAEESPEPRLYGAVSVGDVWKFGFLDRRERRLVEDLNTYSVPTVVERVVEILVGILIAKTGS